MQENQPVYTIGHTPKFCDVMIFKQIHVSLIWKGGSVMYCADFSIFIRAFLSALYSLLVHDFTFSVTVTQLHKTNQTSLKQSLVRKT